MSLPEQYDTEVSDENAALLNRTKATAFSCPNNFDKSRTLDFGDEATSNVDTVTEAKIKKAMDNVIAGRTSFVDCAPIEDHFEC